MFCVVRRPGGTPAENYTEAVCDRCLAPCPESRVPGGRVGRKYRSAARRAALAAGWSERFVGCERRPQRRQMLFASANVQLVCPACRARDEGGAGDERASGGAATATVDEG